MPQIPSISPAVRERAMGMPAARERVSPGDLTKTTDAIASLGSVIKRSAQLAADIVVEENTQAAKKAAVDMDAQSKAFLLYAQQNRALGAAAGLSNDFNEFYANRAEEITAELTPAQRKIFDRNTYSSRKVMESAVLEYQQRELKRNGDLIDDTMLESAIATYAASPPHDEAIVREQSSKIADAIDSRARRHNLPNDVATKMYKDAIGSAKTGQLSGLISTGQWDYAKAYIEKNKDDIPNETVLRATAKINAAEESALRQAREIAVRDVTALGVQRASGVIKASPYDDLKTIKSIVKDDQLAEELHENIVEQTTLGMALNEVQHLSAERYAQDEESLRASMENEADPAKWAEKKRRYDTLVKARQTAMNYAVNSPAEWAMGEEVVKSEWSKLGNAKTPEEQRVAGDRFKAAMFGMQESIGLSKYQMQLVPPAYAENIANILNDSSVAPDAKLEAMARLENVFGEDAWLVYSQARGAENAKLSDSAMMTVAMYEGENGKYNARLSMAATASWEENKKNMLPDDKEAIQSAIAGGLEALRKTLAVQGDYTTGNKVSTWAQQVATHLVINAGVSPDEAAQTAVDMMNNRYDYTEYYRVPKTAGGRPVDTLAVTRNVDRYANDITTQLAKEFKNSTVYKGLDGAGKRVVDATLQGNIVFITSADESGLVPMIKAQNGISGEPMLGKNGQPLVFAWDDLARMSLISRSYNPDTKETKTSNSGYKRFMKKYFSLEDAEPAERAEDKRSLVGAVGF